MTHAAETASYFGDMHIDNPVLCTKPRKDNMPDLKSVQAHFARDSVHEAVSLPAVTTMQQMCGRSECTW